jgi:REP element-mobilizing transposase RayT
MTNHLNLIIGTKNNPMQDIMRDLKGFTSKAILKAIEDNPQESRKEWMLWMFKRAGLKNSNNKNYQFWQQNNQPIELETNEMFDQKLDYIHKNPVEEGFVEKEEHYIYSSAKDYLGEKGFIKIEIVLCLSKMLKIKNIPSQRLEIVVVVVRLEQRGFLNSFVKKH